MAFSKVILNGTTLIDLTADTATDAFVASPKTYHKADGTSSTGTATIAVNFLLVYEFSQDKSSVTFTPSYADTKTAIQNNAKFTYMDFADYACGMVVGVSTNFTFHGTTFSECCRFFLEDAIDGGMYQVAWGYVSGSLTTRTYKVYSNVPTGTINITQNGTTDVSSYASANVQVPQTGTDFIVTVSWNSSTSKYEPDCTMAQLWSAFQAGKTISVSATDISDIITADGFWSDDEVFVYFVHARTNAGGIEGTKWYAYVWTTSSITLHDEELYIQPTGTKAISTSGNTDVTNYATASVPTASFYTGEEHGFYTESNVRKWRYRGMTDLDIGEGDTEGWHGHGRQYGDYKVHNAVQTATITPSTSSQTIGGANYMMEGAVTVSGDANLVAGNIKSGTTIFGVTGTYSGGSSKNVQAYIGYAQRTANSYGATTVTLTVAKTGTYKVSWTAWRGSSSGTMGTNLHKNSTAGTNQQTWTGTYGQNITLTNQSLSANDVLTVWATSGSNSRSVYVGNLVIEEQ